MPTKVFTLMGGQCPFDKGCEIDSSSCRNCQWYYRVGTGTFFWCNHQKETESKDYSDKPSQNHFREPTKMIEPKRKRGRPPGKAAKKPVKRMKNKK